MVASGRKRHIVVDTLGLLIVVMVTAANAQDRDGGRRVLDRAKTVMPSIATVWADGGYAGKLVAFQERLLPLGRVGTVNGLTRERQPHGEQEDLRADPGEVDPQVREVDLALGTGLVGLRDERILQRLAGGRPSLRTCLGSCRRASEHAGTDVITLGYGVLPA